MSVTKVDEQATRLSKDQILGFVRQGLTFLASFLTAYFVQSGEILTASIPAIVGIVVVVWGWIDKSNRDLSVWYSFARHVFSTAGGFVLGFGWLPENTWNAIVSGALGFLSVILSMVENAKKTA